MVAMMVMVMAMILVVLVILTMTCTASPMPLASDFVVVGRRDTPTHLCPGHGEVARGLRNAAHAY